MGWPNEPHRHALASRGIRTNAIENPVANSKWYRKDLYDSEKKPRRYSGSGLEGLSKEQVVDWVNRFVDRINQIALEGDEYDNDVNVKIEAIYLIGSRVGGFHAYDSDLDIILVFKDLPLYHVWQVEDIIDNFRVDGWMENSDDDYLITDDNERILVDVIDWGWKEPHDDKPSLLIWEAP